MKTLSVIIPAFNEERYIYELIQKVKLVQTETLGYEKEIIVVDDGSNDKTADLVKNFTNVKLIQQKNKGKGAAVQTGVAQSKGDYIIVQDADLEYNPEDYLPMLRLLNQHPGSLIYGSRVKGVIRDHGISIPFTGRHPNQSIGPWIANGILSILFLILYQYWITDLLTAYKVYPGDALRNYDTKTSGFETDHELTAHFIRATKIKEVPISYDPRRTEDGKKIRAIDGVIAVGTLLRFRFLK